MICITCGGEAGPLSPEMAKAKTRMGMPLDPPKRCPQCVWTSLKKFADSPDDEEQARADDLEDDDDRREIRAEAETAYEEGTS